MRGTPAWKPLLISDKRIIPAHAGNTEPCIARLRLVRDHPRACGEHFHSRIVMLTALGSSPRMRGTHRGYASFAVPVGIIPAHAGNTFPSSRVAVWRGDHPRACGEHEKILLYGDAIPGSSPRMRGTPFTGRDTATDVGIIPAHAGNTIAPAAKTWRFRDHPRACGEHKDVPLMCVMLSGSSPRMRGTLVVGVQDHHVIGIIPAHAGNTAYARTSPAGTGDHPRACGEHMRACLCAGLPLGSSPRMRGTLRSRRSRSLRCGIIPAHAGNT